MAGTISITGQVQGVYDNDKLLWQPGTISVVQSGQGRNAAIVSIGTSEEDISVGDVTTLGYCFMRNLDAANFVKYGPKSSGVMIPFGKLKATEYAIFRLMTGVTIRAIADTGAVNTEIIVMQD